MTEGLLSGGRVVAVGGAKGGSGHSTLSLGLAVFIAQLGKKVLFVDAQPRHTTHGATLGVSRNPRQQPPWAPSALQLRGVETSVPNLRLVEASREEGLSMLRGTRKLRDLAARTPADLVVVDLGSGLSSRSLDMMLDADALLTTATPEPDAVEAVYRLVRNLYARRLGRHLRALSLDPPRGLAEPLDLARRRLSAVCARWGCPPTPLELASAVLDAAPALADAVWSDFGQPKLRVVVNASRMRADLELGDAMARVTHRPFGGTLEYLGNIEYDDAVFLAARRRRPLLIDVPSSKAARNIERLARRLLALEAGRLAQSAATPAGPPQAPTHYEVLAVDRGASDEEIRRAYRKTREIYTADAVALSGLLTDEDLSSMVARIEEARDVLLDPARRRPYELSVTPESERARAPEVAADAASAELELPAAAMPELTAETEYTGALLRAIREARGVRLDEVASRTKIALGFLKALEDEEFTTLPQAVYARGFVTEVAKFLKLDVEQVVRTYMHRYRRAQPS